MVLVVERDECSGQGARSELPVAPDQGVEPETSAGPDHCAELGGCDKSSGEATVWARRIQRLVYFVSEVLQNAKTR